MRLLAFWFKIIQVCLLLLLPMAFLFNFVRCVINNTSLMIGDGMCEYAELKPNERVVFEQHELVVSLVSWRFGRPFFHRFIRFRSFDDY
jgi:hypothetical protein